MYIGEICTGNLYRGDLKMSRAMRVRDLTGEPFGRLIAMEQVGFRGKNKRLYRCQCSCGNTKDVDQYSLRSGKTTSCGCKIKELLRTNVKRRSQALEALNCRWESLVELALTCPNLKDVLDTLEKQFPLIEIE